jgi:hypothetical protein
MLMMMIMLKGKIEVMIMIMLKGKVDGDVNDDDEGKKDILSSS